MFLAKIIGTVVSTRKDDTLIGKKVLIVQPLDARLENDGRTEVAVDSVGSGVGEIVLVARGSSAGKIFDNKNTPIDCTIIAIVDTVEASL
jgi:microcompartment protein CcmK/EutM